MEFGPNHYVPVLFTKAGERDALSEIGDVQKDSLNRYSSFTPLTKISTLTSRSAQSMKPFQAAGAISQNVGEA